MSLSRFDTLPILPAPLSTLLTRAVRSRACAPVRLSEADADLLIREGGGPDPAHRVPQQLYVHDGVALVVRKTPVPIAFRL